MMKIMMKMMTKNLMEMKMMISLGKIIVALITLYGFAIIFLGFE